MAEKMKENYTIGIPKETYKKLIELQQLIYSTTDYKPSIKGIVAQCVKESWKSIADLYTKLQ